MLLVISMNHWLLRLLMVQILMLIIQFVRRLMTIGTLVRKFVPTISLGRSWMLFFILRKKSAQILKTGCIEMFMSMSTLFNHGRWQSWSLSGTVKFQLVETETLHVFPKDHWVELKRTNWLKQLIQPITNKWFPLELLQLKILTSCLSIPEWVETYLLETISPWMPLILGET